MSSPLSVCGSLFAPVPKRRAQINIGASSAEIHVEAFLDVLCPDCDKGWTTLKKLSDVYGKDKLQIGVRMFPLPYHRNAFIASRAVMAVNAVKKEAVVPFLDSVFTNIAPLSVDATPYDEVVSLLAKLAGGVGVPPEQFHAALTDKSTDQAVRGEWKLGCSRTVCGTPTFFVNGALSRADEEWSVDLWKSLLDPCLLESASSGK